MTTHKQSKQMKARAERITGEAVKAAIAAMANLRKDLKPIMQDMEATHEMDELAQNLNYCALVAADNGLAQALHDVNNWISGKFNTK